MPETQQEQVEDYLELERFISKIQAGQRASLSPALTPLQASVYRMALLLHAAGSAAMSEPDTGFAESLRVLLIRQLQARLSGNGPQADTAPTDDDGRPGRASPPAH